MSSGDNKQIRKGTALTLVLLTIIGIAIVAFVWLQLFLQPPPLRAASPIFLVEPYLQMGDHPDAKHLELVWASLDEKDKWSVQLSPEGGETTVVDAVMFNDISIAGLPHFRLFETPLGELPQNVSIAYKVLRNNVSVFEARINPLHADSTSYRFAVFGDIASGLQGQRDVANALYKAKPDMVLVAGDIVYPFGRALEYLDHFFPIYNADKVSANGVPMLRSTLWVAAPGNHDVAVGGHMNVRNLDQFPDGLAYFIFWKQPLDGPPLTADGPNVPVAEGSQSHRQDFLNAAGKSYPRMTNFSFDYGNAHWTSLDGDAYVNWTDPKLRDWLDQDLKSAKNATWKFVIFHQPPFNSDQSAHFREQRMRLLSDVFEKNHVDVVWSGHVHNYQRTYPLLFHARKQPNGAWIAANGMVDGAYVSDNQYDGLKDTHPNGPIYVITGGGGAHLSGKNFDDQPSRWQPYTAKFLARHSFTQCDVENKKLVVRQIGTDGSELDHFEINK